MLTPCRPPAISDFDSRAETREAWGVEKPQWKGGGELSQCTLICPAEVKEACLAASSKPIHI